MVGSLENRFDGLDSRFGGLEQKFDARAYRFDGLEHRFDDLVGKVEEFKDEMTRHFDVVVEDLRHDLIGARSDELEVLKNCRQDHEKRIRRLEKSAGLIAA
jgi:septation ring formation regulator EzrA